MQNKKWCFDKNVAHSFTDIAKKSIPGYSNVIEMSAIIACNFISHNAKIYDLGCALCASTIAIGSIISYKNCTVIAVDNSRFMIDLCKKKLEKHKLPISIKFLEKDIRSININSASVVILNFTLQFIPFIDKINILKAIFHGLQKGGVLILSEKFAFDNVITSNFFEKMHYNFKLNNGYTKFEIDKKKSMLKHAMFIETIKHHKNRLKKIGFLHVMLWFQCLNFGSFIAIKS